MSKKNLNKTSIENILKEEKVYTKFRKLTEDISGNIGSVLEINDNRLQEIVDGINVNKRNNGINKGYGMPEGTIECCGYTINIDEVLEGLTYKSGNSKVTHGNLGKIIKEQYKIALDSTGDEKEIGLEKATKLLAGAILLFITELEKLPDDSTEATTEKSDNKKLDPNKIYRDIGGRYEEIPEFDFNKLIIRNRVAKQISDLRKDKWESDKLKDIKGKIELRDGETFDLNDKSFKGILEYYGKQYDGADDKRKMEIDTELAERIILHRGYYIQVNDLLEKSDPNYVSSYIPQLNNCRDGLEKISLDVVGEHIKHKGEDYLVVRLNNIIPPTLTETETETETETQTETETETQTETETETPTIIPPTPTETETETEAPTVFEENVVLSDVSESYEDLISREVENEINEERHNTSKFNVFKRGKLFLMRGRIRKNRIKEMKKNYEKTPFTNNGTINREMVKQAARHDLEEILGEKKSFGKIKRTTLINGDEIESDDTPSTRFERKEEFRQMCQKYVKGELDKGEFKKQFNKFVKEKLTEQLNTPRKEQFLGTNVLDKLDAIKEDNILLEDITKELKDYLNDKNEDHFKAIRNRINDDFTKYKRDPRFRKEIMNILGDTSGLSEKELKNKINGFINHQKALAKASMTNLQIKLDFLEGGKGAYQTNNKDRENWLFKFGNKLDKMPRWGQALTVAGISAASMLTAGGAAALGVGAVSIPLIGSVSGAGLIGTATLSSLVGAKAAIKKYTHHTKEQNTYEKNLTRNYEEEIAKMKEWENIRTEKDSEGKYVHKWFTRYRAKRQLELYGKTTQEHLQNGNEGNTRELADFIYTGLERYDSLEDKEKEIFNYTLLDALARLETYREMGHNFLKSKDKNQIERDFYNLENALNLSAKHIISPSATLKDLPAEIVAYKGGKEVNYDDLLKKYKEDYNSASKEFRYERACLATKWGLGTAAITFGTSAAAQAATGTGMFAKDAIAATPSTPDSTSTTNTGTVMDNYGMGKYELSGGNKIFQAAQDNISGLNSTDTVTLHLGSGTDGTAVRAGSSLLNHSTYLDKLDQVKDVIANSSLSNKADLIRQVNSGFSTSGFTNTDLHGMRCLEAIEETVKGAGNFAGNLNISYDTALNIDGAVAHDAASRMSQAFLEISTVVPGEPGREAVKGGAKWLVFGLPWFSNTFKRNNDGKTEQKPVAPVIDKPNDNGNDKPKDKGRDNGDNKPTDKPSDKPADKPDKKATDKGKDKGADKGKNKGHSSSIIIPPVKSDERHETNENTNEKEEVVTDELKKDVRDFLYGSQFKYLLNEDRYRTIRKNNRKLELVENAGDEWEARFKDSPRASARLEEAKNFRKRFPKINFYDENVVKSLKEEFKENSYVLEHIDHEINNLNGLNPKFKHYLEKSEIDKYRDKAKSLVESAISEGSYGDMDHEMIIIKVSDDLTIPFYVSDGSGGKLGVPVDRFYPIFGIGPGGRLNKGHESEINNYYGSPLLAAIAEELNKRYDDKDINPHDRKKDFSQEFKDKANKGKKPVDGGTYYNNINETLKKVSKIKAFD